MWSTSSEIYAQISPQWPMQAKATSDLFIHLQADRGRDESSDAKSVGYQEDILAVCKLHGYHGTPTVQNQLHALDREYQQLKEQGLSGKADYVQMLETDNKKVYFLQFRTAIGQFKNWRRKRDFIWSRWNFFNFKIVEIVKKILNATSSLLLSTH